MIVPQFDGLPLFAFNLLMVDPPWRFDTWSDQGKKHKSPEGHYRTMTLEQIKALPVGHLAAKDAVLWLWATHPMFPLQLECVRAWGFTYVTSGVWVKRTAHGKLAFGTGYRLRCASEPFIIAVNGKPDTARNVRTVIEGPVREHSRKPDEAFAAAEALVGDVPKVEIFGRQSRPGWSVWGDQATKFDAVAP